MSNLLVTGAAGFIGSNFVRYWRKKYANDGIVAYDALTYAGNKDNLQGIENVDFVHGDIRDYGKLKELLVDRGIDTIVHFAAESHVDRSIDGPDAFIDTNILGTHNLLKVAKQIWLDEGSGTPHCFHHISTDEVFGSLAMGAPAFHENTPYAPNSPYSASKAAADHLVRSYHHTFGLQTITTNCSNNYGPYQFPEKLIPLFLINCLKGKKLPIYGDGKNVRDWLHVEDHCYGIELALQKGIPGECYNIGGGEELSNISVVDLICSSVDRAFQARPDLKKKFPNAPAASGGSSVELKTFIEDRLGHDRRYAIDERKAKERLDYAPKWKFSLGLEDTLDWYLNHISWWSPNHSD